MSKTKTVYVAARMRGVPYYNFPAFDAARDRLVKLGVTVLSPADMDRADGFDPLKWGPSAIDNQARDNWGRLPLGFDLAAAIERDNKAIDMADGIYVIHEGIADSKGGMAEIERGMSKGKVIVYDTMDDEAILKALGVETASATVALDKQYASAYAGSPLDKNGDPIRTATGIVADIAAFCEAHNEAMGLEETPRMAALTPDMIKKAYEKARDKQQPRYTEREGVLDEAKKLITGDRNNSYGPPTQDFQRTADMMSALFSAKLKEGERFKPSDVAWIITLVKASRAQHSPKRDNYVDAAGYMGCGWECEAETLKRETPGVQQGAKGTHV